VELDGQTIFAIVGALIALAVVGGAVAFALWYQGDQAEL
jgi:hypothetical protein